MKSRTQAKCTSAISTRSIGTQEALPATCTTERPNTVLPPMTTAKPRKPSEPISDFSTLRPFAIRAISDTTPSCGKTACVTVAPSSNTTSPAFIRLSSARSSMNCRASCGSEASSLLLVGTEAAEWLMAKTKRTGASS